MAAKVTYWGRRRRGRRRRRTSVAGAAMTLHVKTFSGQTIPVAGNRGRDTVADLKVKVGLEVAAKAATLKLFYKGAPLLDDGVKLVELGIHDGSVLHTVLKPQLPTLAGKVVGMVVEGEPEAVRVMLEAFPTRIDYEDIHGRYAPLMGEEVMTKAEYNRWLVRQENAKMAEETRQAAKQGEDIIKDRQRKHTTQGLSRQQAAMVQMKKASESLEAHRQQNLTQGRKVYEEVAGWRVGALSYPSGLHDALLKVRTVTVGAVFL